MDRIKRYKIYSAHFSRLTYYGKNCLHNKHIYSLIILYAMLAIFILPFTVTANIYGLCMCMIWSKKNILKNQKKCNKQKIQWFWRQSIEYPLQIMQQSKKNCHVKITTFVLFCFKKKTVKFEERHKCSFNFSTNTSD